MTVSSDKVAIGVNAITDKCGKNQRFLGAQHLFLSKNDLLSNTANPQLAYTMPDENGIAERPVKLTGEGSDIMFVGLVRDPANLLRIIKYSGDLLHLNRLVYVVPIKKLESPPSIQQSDTSLKIGSLDYRVQSAAMSPDNKIVWLTSMDSCKVTNDLQDRSCIRLIQFNASSREIYQDFDIAAKGIDLIYPALAVSGSGNMILVLGYSSASHHPGLATSGQFLNSPVKSYIPVKVIFPGIQSNQIEYCNDAHTLCERTIWRLFRCITGW